MPNKKQKWPHRDIIQLHQHLVVARANWEIEQQGPCQGKQRYRDIVQALERHVQAYEGTPMEPMPAMPKERLLWSTNKGALLGGEAAIRKWHSCRARLQTKYIPEWKRHLGPDLKPPSGKQYDEVLEATRAGLMQAADQGLLDDEEGGGANREGGAEGEEGAEGETGDDREGGAEGEGGAATKTGQCAWQKPECAAGGGKHSKPHPYPGNDWLVFLMHGPPALGDCWTCLSTTRQEELEPPPSDTAAHATAQSASVGRSGSVGGKALSRVQVRRQKLLDKPDFVTDVELEQAQIESLVQQGNEARQAIESLVSIEEWRMTFTSLETRLKFAPPNSDLALELEQKMVEHCNNMPSKKSKNE